MQFEEVTNKKYQDQGIFFLNAFWAECSTKADEIYKFWNQVCELDYENKAEGNHLDEFNAHRFFEKNNVSMTVQQMRQSLKVKDPKFKKIAFIEFLLYFYKQTVEELMKRPQGTNEAVAVAQKALEDVNAQIKKIEDKKKELEAKANGTGVAAMRAKAELEQLLSGDKTELNRAVLTAEAALRKAQKLGGDSPQGLLWWMNRELEEAKKYKPQKN